MQKFFSYLFKEWFRQVGEALLLAFLFTTFVFTTVGVVGKSMDASNGSGLPGGSVSLRDGERVFIPKYETWLVRFGLSQWQRGQIVIVKPPPDAPNALAQIPFVGLRFRAFFIKRLVGLPGDTVSVREGVVYLNGTALSEKHITDQITPHADNYPGVCYLGGKLTALFTQQGIRFSPTDLPTFLKPTLEMLVPPSQAELDQSANQEYCYTGSLTLKKGYYFVMGDNRALGGSEDSRTLGPIAASTIAGRASAVWFPLGSARGLPIPDVFKDLAK
jgi:signal peptidase I